MEETSNLPSAPIPDIILELEQMLEEIDASQAESDTRMILLGAAIDSEAEISIEDSPSGFETPSESDSKTDGTVIEFNPEARKKDDTTKTDQSGIVAVVEAETNPSTDEMDLLEELSEVTFETARPAEVADPGSAEEPSSSLPSETDAVPEMVDQPIGILMTDTPSMLMMEGSPMGLEESTQPLEPPPVIVVEGQEPPHEAESLEDHSIADTEDAENPLERSPKTNPQETEPEMSPEERMRAIFAGISLSTIQVVPSPPPIAVSKPDLSIVEKNDDVVFVDPNRKWQYLVPIALIILFTVGLLYGVHQWQTEDEESKSGSDAVNPVAAIDRDSQGENGELTAVAPLSTPVQADETTTSASRTTNSTPTKASGSSLGTADQDNPPLNTADPVAPNPVAPAESAPSTTTGPTLAMDGKCEGGRLIMKMGLPYCLP